VIGFRRPPDPAIIATSVLFRGSNVTLSGCGEPTAYSFRVLRAVLGYFSLV